MTTPDNYLPSRRGRAVWVAAVVALIAGTAARLLFPDLTAFGLDEGIASILTTQLIYKGQVPLVGVKTGLFFYNPPLLPWLLAPAFAIGRNPAVATEWIALLNVAAVLGMGWCAWRLSGRNGAIAALAILLAALSPTWIEQSRRLWGHALMLPATVAALCFAVRWFLDGKRWALAGLVASIAAAQALHFSGSLLWVSFGLLWLLTPRERKPRIGFGPLAVGLAITLLWYGPYIVHLAKTGFLDLRIIFAAALGHARAAGHPIGSPGGAFLFLLGDSGHNDLMGISPSTWPGFYKEFLGPVRIVSAGLSINGLLYAIIVLFGNRESRKHAVQTSESQTKGRITGNSPPSDRPGPSKESDRSVRPVRSISGEPPKPTAQSDQSDLSDQSNLSHRSDTPRSSRSASLPPLFFWGLVLSLVPPLAFSVVRASFVPAYLLPAAPGMVLLVAGLAADPATWRRNRAPQPPSNRKRFLGTRAVLIALIAAWSILAVLNRVGVIHTLSSATPQSQTFTTLRDQQNAVAWIVNKANGEPALVTQGERQVTTGIDYSYLYLLWAKAEDATRFRRMNDWNRLFLIRNSKERLTPEVSRALEAPEIHHVVFGTLTVYEAGRTAGGKLIGVLKKAAH